MVGRLVSRLLLRGGIFNGATSGVSFTGATIAVRPEAPFHSGRCCPLPGPNAIAAGSVELPTPAPPLCPAREPLRDEALSLSLSGEDGPGGDLEDMVEIPKPRANSTGLTCDGRPLPLFVISPVIGSHRGSFCPRGLSVTIVRPPAAAASRCARRSRRIIGILDRAAPTGEALGGVSGEGSVVSRRRCWDGSDACAVLEEEAIFVGGTGSGRGCVAEASSSSSMGEMSYVGL